MTPEQKHAMDVQERDDARAEEMRITDAIQLERDMMDCAELDAHLENAARNKDAPRVAELQKEIFAIGDVWQGYLSIRLKREMEHARWWHRQCEQDKCYTGSPWWRQAGRSYDPDLTNGPLC